MIRLPPRVHRSYLSSRSSWMDNGAPLAVYLPGKSATFARTGAAVQRGEDDLLDSVATDEIRDDHWVRNPVTGLYERTTLIQPGQTNYFTQSGDLTHADWTVSGISSRTADQAAGPNGVAELDEIVEDSSTGSHRLSQVKTLTADARYTVSAWVLANTRSWVQLMLTEGGVSNNAYAFFDLAAGALGTTGATGTGAFVTAAIEDWGGGLYRIQLVGSVGNGATSIEGRIALASADNTASYAGDGSSSLYAGCAQLEETEGASSYIASTTMAASRNGDVAYTALSGAPQSLTAYARFFEMGSTYDSNYVGVLGVGGVSAPYFTIYHSPTAGDGTYSVSHYVASGVASGRDFGIAIGDLVELRARLFADGSCQLMGVVNEGAEQASSRSAVNALAGAWGEARQNVGGNVSGVGNNAFTHAAVFPGDVSLELCRAWAGV